MAITFLTCDGFDHNAANSTGTAQDARPRPLYTSVVNMGTQTTYVTGRTLSALQCAVTGTLAANVAKRFPASSKLLWRFYFKSVSLPASGGVRVMQCGPMVTATTKRPAIGLLSGGTLGWSWDASSNTGFTAGQTSVNDGAWHSVEVQLDLSANPWTVVWRVDGTTQTSPGTAANAADTLLSVQLGNSGTVGPAATFQLDDWIVGTFTATTDWFGEGHVETLVPPATAGIDTTNSVNLAQFQTHVPAAVAANDGALLDELPATSITDYIQYNGAADAATDKVWVNISDTAASGTANGVSVVTPMHNVSATTANAIRLIVSAGGTDTTVYDNYSIALATIKYVEGNLDAPAGGWTVSNVNGLVAKWGGPTTPDNAPVPALDAVLMQVDWPDTVATAPAWAPQILSQNTGYF